jgi:murein DD-endopeptidase MepM/ murein hydrolase activator NlpD
MKPVPSASIGTPYGRRGPWWSCRRDSRGWGIHTGVDYPAPVGTKVVAARGGKVVYANHGSAFGYHQLEILHGDGTRDFYAHMSKRSVANGAKVRAGTKIGEVGKEGNVTGPHLHFERHAVAYGGWSCTIVRDPAPSIAFQPKRR